MRILVILFMLFTFNDNLNAENINYNIQVIFREHHLDMDTKSARGWIRLFSNKEKLHKYGIYLDDNEIKTIRIYFKKKLKTSKKYNRRIQ